MLRVKHLCTGRKGGREIERSEYQDSVDENNQRVREQADLYKRRQAICEHPFGTIKRAWGYSYTLLRGLSKVDGEMNLIALIYNLRRALNILGFKQMMEALKTWTPKYKKVCCTLKLRLSRSIYSSVVTCCFSLSKTYAAKQVA
ncbi:MAG: transposase [Bacteroidota bacterium]|nr:transposase [Bacteroidota bacterium]